MKEHLLLAKAYIYPLPKSEPILDGCEFDDKKGYWINIQNDMPFIFDEKGRRPQSKKCDNETGEDQKGE